MAGLNLASFGVLRFSSPTRALVFDLQFTGGHSRQNVQDTSGSQSLYTDDVGLMARLGPRWYRGQGKRAVLYHTFGVIGGFRHSCFGGAPGGNCSNSWTGGAYADFGGAYLVTSHLSLGASVGASFAYQHSSMRGPGLPSRTSWSYQGLISGPMFISTFYF